LLGGEPAGRGPRCAVVVPIVQGEVFEPLRSLRPLVQQVPFVVRMVLSELARQSRQCETPRADPPEAGATAASALAPWSASRPSAKRGRPRILGKVLANASPKLRHVLPCRGDAQKATLHDKPLRGRPAVPNPAPLFGGSSSGGPAYTKGKLNGRGSARRSVQPTRLEVGRLVPDDDIAADTPELRSFADPFLERVPGPTGPSRRG